MKYLSQFLIILGFTVAGEALQRLLPLPIPASVWGLVLLFTALCLGIVKLEQVKETSDFFNAIMLMIFVPLGVNLMVSYVHLADYVVQILLIIIVSFFVCFAVTGKTADFIISRKEKVSGAEACAVKEADHE